MQGEVCGAPTQFRLVTNFGKGQIIKIQLKINLEVDAIYSDTLKANPNIWIDARLDYLKRCERYNEIIFDFEGDIVNWSLGSQDCMLPGERYVAITGGIVYKHNGRFRPSENYWENRVRLTKNKFL